MDDKAKVPADIAGKLTDEDRKALKNGKPRTRMVFIDKASGKIVDASKVGQIRNSKGEPLAGETLVDASSATWGAEDSGITGICLSAEVALTGQVAELPDSQGDVQGLCFYAASHTGSYEIITVSGTDLPAHGSAVTIGGLSMYVTGARKVWSYRDWMKMSVQARSVAESAPA